LPIFVVNFLELVECNINHVIDRAVYEYLAPIVERTSNSLDQLLVCRVFLCTLIIDVYPAIRGDLFMVIYVESLLLLIYKIINIDVVSLFLFRIVLGNYLT